MDSAIVISVIGLAVNVVVGFVVLMSFLWRIPTKDDLKRLEDQGKDVEDKADDAILQNQAIRGDLKVLSEKVERLESYFQTPQLKTSKDL